MGTECEGWLWPGGCPEDKDTKISAVKQSVLRKNPKDLGGDLTGIGYRESLL